MMAEEMTTTTGTAVIAATETEVDAEAGAEAEVEAEEAAEAEVEEAAEVAETIKVRSLATWTTTETDEAFIPADTRR